MSTFKEITEGTGLTAGRVKNFFKAICNTFSPAPNEWIDQKLSPPVFESGEQPFYTGSRKRVATSSVEYIPSPKKLKSLNLIAVVHLLPTLPAYLDTLREIGIIKVILFKGAAAGKRPDHMEEMAQWVKDHPVFGDAVKNITKNDLKVEKKVIDLLSDAIKGEEEEILIMDIGGYFAPCLSVLAKPDKLKRKFKLLGIVEDTENGHQKYHHAIENLRSIEGSTFKQPNIFSVARSRMKMTEDYNVGKSLVRAADSILRQSLDLRLEDHRVIGVLGFGKIGSSIAMHLRQQHIGTVIVYDVNPEILLRASSYDFVICTKEQMLQQASFIFCATGNKALTYNDLLNISTDTKRLIIASCTSADDELDVHDGLEHHKCKNSSADARSFSRYQLKRLNGELIDVILLCDGNAVNFSYRAVLGESIRSVQAAMIVCALNLQQMAVLNRYNAGISTLTNEEEMRIARLWLQHFSELDVQLITNVSCAQMKYDKKTIEDNVGDLPVDKILLTELKQHLGLVRSEDTDPIDFMDSYRKLIIAASRGSGKTAVLFDLIHDVRNCYDLIWWFDCNDSLKGTLLFLAHKFHVSSFELSTTELQTVVLEAVLKSLTVQNILLVVDNIQEFTGESASEIIAHTADNTKDTKIVVSYGRFKCHEFLSILDNVVSCIPRRQRRCHIVALYTYDNIDELSLGEQAQPVVNEIVNETNQRWHYLIPQQIDVDKAKKWIISKIPEKIEFEQKEKWQNLIDKIVSVDVRRLTIRLTVSLVTSEWINADVLNDVEQLGNSDRLLYLILLFLKKLEQHNRPFFICAQVASLIQAGGISRETFYRLYTILAKDKHYQLRTTNWDLTWQNLLSILKSYCILKQNLLVPIIHRHVSQHYVPLDYVEIYSVPSSYIKELRRSPLADNTDVVWKYALQLINEGFAYDYYSFNQVNRSKFEQRIVHYLDHATAIIKYTVDWTGKEKYALLLGDLLYRLGSFYLHETRMYSEASTLFAKAKTIFDDILQRTHSNNYNISMKESQLLISMFRSKLMQLICEQLNTNSDEEADKFVKKIEEIQSELEQMPENYSYSTKDDLEKCVFTAVIAIARIRVQQARNTAISKTELEQSLQVVQSNLKEIKDKPNMDERTRSLLLQILGSTYSLLEYYEEAIKSYRLAVSLRESILPSEHPDTARTRYHLANCLLKSVDIQSNNDDKIDNAAVGTIISEAQVLCEKALKIQKTQLSTEHRNLKESIDLRQQITQFVKERNLEKPL
ncbi:unnamed protein product [Adineta steineri]|uniref:S-adenosyl-L-homocysteine hydrolase NAD binding domain-containing protein n=1 Tax=Adineta steineri TaxID=433720 RepID=A0A814DZW5_9BILA|nr:unnamed protein product [Adineta steineri]CAF0962745.1 unnamed protein product [Adineta steineri]